MHQAVSALELPAVCVTSTAPLIPRGLTPPNSAIPTAVYVLLFMKQWPQLHINSRPQSPTSAKGHLEEALDQHQDA